MIQQDAGKINNVTMENIAYLEMQLDELAKDNKNELGLYNGKTGLCICYFLLSDVFKGSLCLSKARMLLNELSDNIGNIEKLNFSEGLSGIGWGIEWMAQNKYIEANTDEILEEVDDELYKSVVYSRSIGISLESGAIGKAMYFYKRLMAENFHQNRFRNICNLECLVLLIDEINDVLLGDETDLSKILSAGPSNPSPPSVIIEIAQSIVFLAKQIPNKINIEIVEKMICAIATFIQQYGSKYTSGINNNMDIAYTYALYAWRVAGILLKDEEWVKEATSFYNHHINFLQNGSLQNTFESYISYKWHNGSVNKSSDLTINRNVKSIFEWLALYSSIFKFDNCSWEEAWLLQ